MKDGTRLEHTISVLDEETGLRLDRLLDQRLPDWSREKLKRAIQDGHCQVDGRCVTKAGMRLQPGQTVTLKLPPPVNELRPEEGDLPLIYCDSALAVVNKPAGLTVHPCPSCPEGTLVHRLLARFPELRRQEGLRPGIVHRLDKDTSGLLVVALTEAVRLALATLFAGHAIYKEYLALVRGVPAPEGEMTEPIGRHPRRKICMAVVPPSQGGREARSVWRVRYADPDGRFALLSVRIFTGRTHQIRVHMAHAGHPLWGDALYGPAPRPGEAPIPRQMLHAWRLRFAHPLTGEEKRFCCPPPDDMRAAFLALTRRMQRVVITGTPGCGKSALTQRLASAGLPTWSADAVVARLYAPGGDGQRFLQGRFGDRFVDEEGHLLRPALRDAMSADPSLRREVETFLHGLVFYDLDQFWKSCEARQEACAVAEIPLYLECRARQPAPSVAPLLIGVSCPQEERHRRLKEYRGWTAEQSALMDSWQWPQARKLQACDLVVDNSGPPETLDAALPSLLERLQAERLRTEARHARMFEQICQE